MVKLNKISLSDSEALDLIKILKLLFKKYRVYLTPGNKGVLQLGAYDATYDFLLDYYTPKHRDDKISIHLREKESNLSLIRINIDKNSFHLNSNGEKIHGNRILIFSNEEWRGKNDGSTHTKAYPLPKEFSDPKDLEQVFFDFLMYINVKEEGKIILPALF